MVKLIRVLLLAGVVLGFAGVAIADPPETIEVDGVTYTLLIIDGEVFYENDDGEIFTYDGESGEVLDAEVSFPD